MKITDLIDHALRVGRSAPAPVRQTHREDAGGSSELGLVTIQTDDGVEGHAFLGSSSRGAKFDAASLIRYLKPLLIGQNPLDRERLYQQMWARNRNTTLRCIGAVDVALWDLAGKVAGLPIHRMLGSFRESIPAYASSEVLPSKEAYAEEAVRIRDGGLSRLQDTSARGVAAGHRDLPPRAQSGRGRTTA